MQGILHEAPSPLLFILVTVALGGAAAWQVGRSIAQTWRPYAILPVYIALLGLAVRFIHYAMFGGTLLSLQYYLVDFLALMALGALGWRMRRAQQMRTQYSFAFAGAGPLSWRRKP